MPFGVEVANFRIGTSQSYTDKTMSYDNCTIDLLMHDLTNVSLVVYFPLML